uniref:Uncharacterized protein n=1 Tax=Leersia perrieri TaxID=77586 RepID=A0A0D9V019_9ORYZ
MVVIAFDLNEAPPPELDLNEPIDLSSIDDWEGPAHELDTHMTRDDGDKGRDKKEIAGGEQDEAGLEAEVQDGDKQLEGGLRSQEQGLNLVVNVKRRRYYSDELKIAIYLELLAKTDPPVLHHGVSKQSCAASQRVWQNGQEKGGIDGVVNKLSKNVGRKRLEIDLEAIKHARLMEHTTLRNLAEALGVKKSTLHKRLMEEKIHRRTND